MSLHCLTADAIPQMVRLLAPCLPMDRHLSPHAFSFIGDEKFLIREKAEMDDNCGSTVGGVEKVKKEEFYLKLKSESNLTKDSETDAIKGRKTRMELKLKTKCVEKVNPSNKRRRINGKKMKTS